MGSARGSGAFTYTPLRTLIKVIFSISSWVFYEQKSKIVPKVDMVTSLSAVSTCVTVEASTGSAAAVCAGAKRAVR